MRCGTCGDDAHPLAGSLMASEDEVWGINRDSRAQRLGLSNAELFAHHTNKLQACVVSIGAELGYKKDAFLFVWDDMLNPAHTGGRVFSNLVRRTLGEMVVLFRFVGFPSR